MNAIWIELLLAGVAVVYITQQGGMTQVLSDAWDGIWKNVYAAISDSAEGTSESWWAKVLSFISGSLANAISTGSSGR